MAWYPLYRIPEAPLNVRFLTFHTLAPLWEAATAAPTEQQARQRAAAAAATEACAREAVEAAKPVLAALSSRPSYKSMLTAGMARPAAAPGPPGQRQGGIASATPTGVCSFPGSPTCSDCGTRTTSGGSGRGRAGGPGAPEAGSDTASADLAPSLGSGSSVPPSPATSEADGEELEAGGGSAAPALPLPLPVAGLTWYNGMSRGEEWATTLVAAQLPPGACCVLGSCRRSTSGLACNRGGRIGLVHWGYRVRGLDWRRLCGCCALTCRRVCPHLQVRAPVQAPCWLTARACCAPGGGWR